MDNSTPTLYADEDEANRVATLLNASDSWSYVVTSYYVGTFVIAVYDEHGDFLGRL